MSLPLPLPFMLPLRLCPASLPLLGLSEETNAGRGKVDWVWVEPAKNKNRLMPLKDLSTNVQSFSQGKPHSLIVVGIN